MIARLLLYPPSSPLLHLTEEGDAGLHHADQLVRYRPHVHARRTLTDRALGRGRHSARQFPRQRTVPPKDAGGVRSAEYPRLLTSTPPSPTCVLLFRRRLFIRRHAVVFL